MDITIRPSDRFRVQVSQAEHFVDISAVDYQGIKVEAYPHFHYIEVRKKQGQLATFYFRCKRDKNQADLDWWQDAEVVFALNETYRPNREGSK